ncbi:maleylpyruvate isomerase family mycothiol-dependent enzyme [Pseudonocardia lutea]|uniref:Maleylpyruvate isomerase family mycothiol-dependent enzyme n=1 Tax=Pseudonocardia lutea TaxID=2172015 RepID=A0ABW1I5Y5_9PSEU
MTDIRALLEAETARLVTALDALDDAQWSAPSLCAGWRVRDVAVHLLMPYELSVPGFLVRMAAARFDFDRLADRWATGDARPHAEVTAALGATPRRPFRVPGAPPEAPLSHLVIHAEDVYRPLGLPHGPSPAAAATVLDQLTGPRARGLVPSGLLAGLTFTTTDADWSLGAGPEVRATASALITTFAGRTAALSELDGDGAPEIHERLGHARTS